MISADESPSLLQLAPSVIWPESTGPESAIVVWMDEDSAEFFAQLRDARLTRLRPLVDGSLRLTTTLIPEVDWAGTAASPLHREMQELGNEAARACLTRAVRFGQFGVLTAVDHTRTLSALLDLDGGVFGPVVTARAAIEAGARSCWLLNPAISAPIRIARLLAYRHSCAGWDLKISNALKSTFSDDEDPAAVIADAAAAGVCFDGGRFDGERSQAETQLVDEFVGAATDEKLKSVYAVLSAIAHGRPKGILLFEVGDRESDKNPLSTRPDHLLPVLQSAIHVTISSLLQSTSILFDYVGFASDSWDSWHDHVMNSLRPVS